MPPNTKMHAIAHIRQIMHSTIFRFLRTSPYPVFPLLSGTAPIAAPPFVSFGSPRNPEKQSPHDETGDCHNPEHHSPRREFEKLRRDNRSQAKAEQSESALLQTLEESAPGGICCSGSRSETRRTIRSFH